MISVIVPVYNKELYIEACLNSIITQIDREVHELIIIDDGSFDDSSDIIKRIINENENYNINYYYQENKGLGSACNLGIKKSKNEYILFVDSDDVLGEGLIKKISETLSEFKPEMIVYGIKNIGLDGSESYANLNLQKNTIMFQENNKQLLMTLPSAKNKLFSKKLFTENEIFFPESLWFEDLMTTTKIYPWIKSWIYIDDVFYEYVHRTDSITASDNLDKNLDIITVCDEIINYYKEENLLAKFKKEITYILILHVMVHSSVRIIKNSSNNISEEKIIDLLNQLNSDFSLRINENNLNLYIKHAKRLLPIKERFIYNMVYYKKYKILFRLLRD